MRCVGSCVCSVVISGTSRRTTRLRARSRTVFGAEPTGRRSLVTRDSDQSIPPPRTGGISARSVILYALSAAHVVHVTGVVTRGFTVGYGCEPLARRISLALIHRCRPSGTAYPSEPLRGAGVLSPTNPAGLQAPTWPLPPGSADRLRGDPLRRTDSDQDWWTCPSVSNAVSIALDPWHWNLALV